MHVKRESSVTHSSPVLSAGIDVGSSLVKVVLMSEEEDGHAKMIAGELERIRRRVTQTVVEGLFDQVVKNAGLQRKDLHYIATTGEGENVEFRTGHFYGMTAHARGGIFLEPEARAVIDIGALHGRAVLMDERAKVLGYRMTSQCASGSGGFLENIGRYLGVTLAEIGPMSLEADNPETCSSICAVLAETDVINMVSRSISIPNILKGIHLSMANRFIRLLVAAGAKDKVLVTGGLAGDVGLVEALRATPAKKGDPLTILTHEHSILAGAIGAALWGAFRYRKLEARGDVEKKT